MNCLVCESELASSDKLGENGGFVINCPRCGYYEITTTTKSLLEYKRRLRQSHDPSEKLNIAAFSTWLREHSNKAKPTFIDDDLINSILSEKIWPLYKKADALLNQIASKMNDFSKPLDIQEPSISQEDERDPLNLNHLLQDLLGISQIENREEFDYICDKYLQNEKQFITYSQTYGGLHIEITPKGWNHLADINKQLTGDICFVAMSFKPEFRSHYKEAIEPAIKETGWTPFCLFDKIHNDYITNQIIAGLKSARFVIADFTENCYGVYYEAGFAKGLGAEVIHMVREDYIKDPKKKVHFDTQQMNHLIWKKDDSKDSIKQRLKDWIIVTVGAGPNITIV